MKRSNFIFATIASALTISSSFAQIIPANMPDINVAGAVENSGVAIAPFYHWNAIVTDDLSSGTYRIQWRNHASGAWLDGAVQNGIDPDVAYYANADAVVVCYENGGAVLVDDYYLQTVSPVNYNLNTNNFVAPGENPNIDMNSSGRGVLTWEDGGMVMACAFNIGTFTPGPIIPVAPGTQPDIIVLDDNKQVIITYVQGGMLMVESYYYPDFASGSLALIASHTMPIGNPEWPRLASQRNSNFGPAEHFTVVAQDNMGAQYDVLGFFFTSPTTFNPALVNQGVNSCGTFEPKPVVAYDRGRVHVAWGQRYDNACAPGYTVTGDRDVLLGEFDFLGNNSNGPGVYREVNTIQLNFMNSATSINTEYDGNYLITSGNYCEGIVYNNPGDGFWKARHVGQPVFTPQVNNDQANVTVVKGPESEMIEVTITSDNEELTPAFTLYDNTGRLVSWNSIEQEGNQFYLRASQMKAGIYLLHCIVDGELTTVRLPHFAN